MIKISFDDPNLVENFKAIQFLRKTGLYTDEQLQELYDKQLEKDKDKQKYKEIFVLRDMMDEAKIPYEFNTGFLGGYHLRYHADGNCVCSVVEHDHSYGNNEDRLEIMGLLTEEEEMHDSVVGHLTAEDVFRRIKEHWNRRADDGQAKTI